MIADVGQGLWEEINVGLAANYGWPCREGAHDYRTDPGCDGVATADPVVEKSHSPDGFCAIVGGYVVRDPGLPTLIGRYIYGDNCNSALRSVNLAAPAGDAADGHDRRRPGGHRRGRLRPRARRLARRHRSRGSRTARRPRATS